MSEKKKNYNFNFDYPDNPAGAFGKWLGNTIADAISTTTQKKEDDSAPDYSKILTEEVAAVQPAASAAVTSEPEAVTAAEETPEYQKYYDMRDEYIDQYLNRDGFTYDVDADEIYKGYQKQIQADADRARRQTAAQAASLTGGYGSSYASAMGQAAYNDTMDGLDDVRASLYEAAYNRYQNEGADMLARAELAGAQGDALYQKTPEYLEQVLSAYALSDEGREAAAAAEKEAKARADEEYAIEQALRTTQGLYDFRGKNNTGANWYNEALRIYAGVDETGKIKDKFLGEHADYSRSQIIADLMSWEDKEGTKMTRTQAEYMADVIEQERAIVRLSGMVSSNGNSLVDYIEALKLEGKSGEEVYKLLSSWKDKSGAGLSEDDINIILSAM